MGYCDSQIKADIEANCVDPLIMGVEQEGVIINRSDINYDELEYDAENSSILTNLPLVTGARGYRVIIPTKSPFAGTTTEIAEGTSRNAFINTVGMVILANDPNVSENIIDGLANGEFVVIIENKNKSLNAATPGFSAFQVYGLLQGLRATTLSNDKYSTDTDGGWNVVLTEDRTPKSAIYLFASTLAATRTLVNSLVTVAP